MRRIEGRELPVGSAQETVLVAIAVYISSRDYAIAVDRHGIGPYRTGSGELCELSIQGQQKADIALVVAKGAGCSCRRVHGGHARRFGMLGTEAVYRSVGLAHKPKRRAKMPVGEAAIYLALAVDADGGGATPASGLEGGNCAVGRADKPAKHEQALAVKSGDHAR